MRPSHGFSGAVFRLCALRKLDAPFCDAILICVPAVVPAGSEVPETDSVLATAELQDLLAQQGIDLSSLPGSPFDNITGAVAAPGSAATAAADDGGGVCKGDGRASGTGTACGSSSSSSISVSVAPAAGSGAATVLASSGSGGYLEHVLRSAAWQLFGQQLPPGPLTMRPGRNAGELLHLESVRSDL